MNTKDTPSELIHMESLPESGRLRTESRHAVSRDYNFPVGSTFRKPLYRNSMEEILTRCGWTSKYRNLGKQQKQEEDSIMRFLKKTKDSNNIVQNNN